MRNSLDCFGSVALHCDQVQLIDNISNIMYRKVERKKKKLKPHWLPLQKPVTNNQKPATEPHP